MTVPVSPKWAAMRDRRLADATSREQFQRTRITVIEIRRLLQRIDAERERAGLSKSELARRAGTTPAAVRRLFTSPSANPTLRMVLDLFDALDLEITLQPRTTPDCTGSPASGTREYCRR